MTTTRKSFQLLFALTIATLFLNKMAFGQVTGVYSYLIQCFKVPTIDSFKAEIDNMGEIMSINYGSDSIEPALSFYDIPENKKNKSTVKLAEIAADRHIQTWKNNSRIILKNKYKSGAVTIIDLRLHLLIEDIFMQVIIICEEDRIYELMCFRDTSDKTFFDSLTQKVKMKICL